MHILCVVYHTLFLQKCIWINTNKTTFYSTEHWGNHKNIAEFICNPAIRPFRSNSDCWAHKIALPSFKDQHIWCQVSWNAKCYNINLGIVLTDPFFFSQDLKTVRAVVCAAGTSDVAWMSDGGLSTSTADVNSWSLLDGEKKCYKAFMFHCDIFTFNMTYRTMVSVVCVPLKHTPTHIHTHVYLGTFH